MTVLSAQTIQRLNLVYPTNRHRDRNGNSCGLSACGVDLTLDGTVHLPPGGFALAAAKQLFDIPPDVMGVVHDKSSLARRGLAVQNTVLEPGWRGYLTLELTNHGNETFDLLPGDAICQVIFHRLDAHTDLPYDGKYQDQPPGPQGAR